MNKEVKNVWYCWWKEIFQVFNYGWYEVEWYYALMKTQKAFDILNFRGIISFYLWCNPTKKTMKDHRW